MGAARGRNKWEWNGWCAAAAMIKLQFKSIDIQIISFVDFVLHHLESVGMVIRTARPPEHHTSTSLLYFVWHHTTHTHTCWCSFALATYASDIAVISVAYFISILTVFVSSQFGFGSAFNHTQNIRLQYGASETPDPNDTMSVTLCAPQLLHSEYFANSSSSSGTTHPHTHASSGFRLFVFPCCHFCFSFIKLRHCRCCVHRTVRVRVWCSEFDSKNKFIFRDHFCERTTHQISSSGRVMPVRWKLALRFS